LREVLAGAPQNYAARGERPVGAKRGDMRPKSKRAAGWFRFFSLKRRPGTKIFLGLAAIAAIGVPLNALYLQDGRHPAPLFHFGAPEDQAAKSAEAAPPLPPQRPLALTQTKSATAGTEATKTDAARSSDPVDLITRLLEGAAPKAAPAPAASRTAAPRSAPQKSAAKAPVKNAITKSQSAKSQSAKSRSAKSRSAKSQPAKTAPGKAASAAAAKPSVKAGAPVKTAPRPARAQTAKADPAPRAAPSPAANAQARGQ
jgi:hypothetical protein